MKPGEPACSTRSPWTSNIAMCDLVSEAPKYRSPVLKSTMPTKSALMSMIAASGLGRAMRSVPMIAPTTGSGKVTSANYQAKARYQKGEVAFQIVLMKIDDRWMIHGFHVDSAALATALGKRT